MIKIRDMIPS